MELKLPICGNCNGTGNDGAGKDPICKGAGRMALDDTSSVAQWLQWIREQPDVGHAGEVLALMLALRQPPAGLQELVETKRDD